MINIKTHSIPSPARTIQASLSRGKGAKKQLINAVLNLSLSKSAYIYKTDFSPTFSALIPPEGLTLRGLSRNFLKVFSDS